MWKGPWHSKWAVFTSIHKQGNPKLSLPRSDITALPRRPWVGLLPRERTGSSRIPNSAWAATDRQWRKRAEKLRPSGPPNLSATSLAAWSDSGAARISPARPQTRICQHNNDGHPACPTTTTRSAALAPEDFVSWESSRSAMSLPLVARSAPSLDDHRSAFEPFRSSAAHVPLTCRSRAARSFLA